MIAWFCRCRIFDVVPWLAIAALVLSACDTLPSANVMQPSVPPRAPADQKNTGIAPPSPPETVVTPYQLPSLTGPGSEGQGVRLSPPAMPPPAPGTVRVALLVPLSGRQADLGHSMLDAAQLALFDIADQRFELLPYDTGGTPEGAAAAAQFAVGDGVSVILGPLLAGSVQAVAPSAWAANIPVIAFSSDRSVAGDGVYVMGFTPGSEVARVVSYAYSQGLMRFALLAPDNAYGARVVTALDNAAAAIGAIVTRVELYDPATGDFDGLIRRLVDPTRPNRGFVGEGAGPEERDRRVRQFTLARLDSEGNRAARPFDALLVADGGRRLQAIAAHLPVHGIDPSTVHILGTGAWDEPGTGAEPALLGGWFAAPQPDFRAGFEQRYAETYGRAPARLATLAYDATALAAVLAQTPGGGVFDAKTLTDPRGFAGRDGIFRFQPDGVAERALAVLRVERHGAEVISEAPTTFEPQ
jgi:ABC-type branched-subunit amino acid transport system substrate-binding protein